MKQFWLWLPVVFALLAMPVFGETVHLKTGESIQGRIVRVDDQSISIESSTGFGVIQIERADIVLIEFDGTERDPSRTIGLGYLHRTAPTAQSGQAVEYAIDAFSLKYWLNATDSVDFLLGFFNNTDSDRKVLEIFSFDVRLARVFRRAALLDLYWGGSVGYINVIDRTGSTTFEDTGTTVRAFLGAEIFFITLPGLGISAEVGVGNQSIGERSTTSLSTSTFPTMSMRYYF